MRAYLMYTYTRKGWMNGGENLKLKKKKSDYSYNKENNVKCSNKYEFLDITCNEKQWDKIKNV